MSEQTTDKKIEIVDGHTYTIEYVDFDFNIVPEEHAAMIKSTDEHGNVKYALII